MESRIIKLEEAIKTLATKADVEKGFGEIKADMNRIDAGHVRWMIATIIALLFGFSTMIWTMGGTLNATTNTLINEARLSRSMATPAPTAPQQPLVVVVPQGAQQAPQETTKAE